MSIKEESIIGQGLVFPINIDSNGGVRPETGKSLIESSLNNILGTPNNLRYFLGQFNCRVHELLHEPTDRLTGSLAEAFVQEAVQQWEPRIELTQTTTVVYETKIVIELEYIIKSTGQEETFIFPFYNTLIY